MKLKKKFISIICIVLCLAFCPIYLGSCGVSRDVVMELGPYEIREDHYRYLASTYRKNIGVSTGYDGYDWDKTEISSGYTIAQYMNSNFQEQFKYSVYTLLYCQVIFDSEGLKLSQENIDMIESNVKTVVNSYGGYSEQQFDQNVKRFGYDADTLRDVYTMRAKQTLVVEHLYGKNGEKLSDDQLNAYFKENYIRFQLLIINNQYKFDEDKKVVMLTDKEKYDKNNIIYDLSNLYNSNPNPNYEYKEIDASLSYEELYERYSDDKTYPKCAYAKKSTTITPDMNVLTAATVLKEGDVGRVVARRTFDKAMTIGNTSVNAGDYYDYGYIFVKRYSTEDYAFNNEDYKQFFTNLREEVATDLFGKHIADYQANGCPYTMMEDPELISEITISSVEPNNVDYKYLYPTKEEESSK